MKTKIKDNWLALYMANDEVIKAFNSKDLNLRDEIEEKINFLEKMQWQEIIVKWFDDEEIKISEYNNSKSYIFPLQIIQKWESKEEEKEEDIKEEIEEIKKDNLFIKYKTMISYILIVILIWCMLLIFFNDEMKKYNSEKNEITSIEIIYDEIQKKEEQIAKELEIQHQARKLENESVEKVKKIEKEIQEKRLEALNFSNKLD